MWGCNSLIWVAIAILLVAIVLFVIHWRRSPEQREIAKINLGYSSLALAILSILLAVTMNSYMTCSFQAGPCPPAIGGSGYTCTNTGSPCFGIIPGKCQTVAGYWPWESACECKCE